MNLSPAFRTGPAALSCRLPAFVVALAGLGLPACSTAQEDKTNFGAVAHSVQALLGEYHYTGEDFEDKLSSRALTNYLDTLDYSRLYFTKPEIDAFFAKYETELDDQIQLYYRIDPAHEIYKVYAKHVTDRVGKIKALLESGKLDFTGDETVEITRKEAKWVNTEAELDELWRKEIIREVLLERINLAHVEKRKKEKPAAGTEKEKGKVEKKTPDTPEQKVLKRHNRFLDTLKQTDEEDITNYFLSAVATAYDPHSEYLSAPEQSTFNMEMKKELIGIGAVLQSKDGAAEIKSLVSQGPADKSGAIKMGDLIVGVAQGEGEMEDIDGMKLQRIVEKIRGEANTVVRLKIQPADDPAITREIRITREKVQMKDTLAKGEVIEITNPQSGQPGADKPQKVGWITLDSFYADMERRDGRSATKDVKRVLERLEKEGISGLVIDLRGDGGGSLEEAIKLTGLFVKKGTPVVQQRDQHDRREARKTREAPIYGGPLLVMTDRASASASEIFAAALQDCGRAVIVGDNSTFGKGTVQTLLEVKEHMPFSADKGRAGSLKVTIAKFYRIDGKTTQREGVKPDLILPSRYDAMDVGEKWLKDPLPYDTIESLQYDMADTHPLPKDELKSRSGVRIKNNPDITFLQDYITRTRELIKKNTITLNEKTRLAEDTTNEERNRAYKEDRKKRVAEANKNGDPYKVFPVTLDNVDDAVLKTDNEIPKDGQKSLQAMLEEDDDTVVDTDDTFPHGFDPAKLETLHILKDLVELSAKAVPKDTVRRN